MINFIKNRILFISTYDVAFGDFIMNSMIIRDILDHLGYNVLIHFLVSDTIYERVSWFIESQNISDRNFIQPINSSICIDKFKNYPSNYYDYIIIDHVYTHLDSILNHFCPKEFLSVREYNNIKIKNLYNYFNISSECKKTSFKYDLEKIKLTIDKLSKTQKYIILFPFSTRPMASINVEGIYKINEFAKSKNCSLLLAGIDVNVYPFDQGLNTNLNNFNNTKILDDNIINLMGISTSKIIYLSNFAEYVFYGPTGTSILPSMGIIENKNNYLVCGGNSSIANGIRTCMPLGISNVTPIFPKCPFYPCENFSVDMPNIPSIVRDCMVKKHPKCLNEELTLNI